MGGLLSSRAALEKPRELLKPQMKFPEGPKSWAEKRTQHGVATAAGKWSTRSTPNDGEILGEAEQRGGEQRTRVGEA